MIRTEGYGRGMNRLLVSSLLMLSLTGCEPISVADYVQISFPAPAEIDIVCSDGGCEQLDTLAVNMTWDEDPLFLEGSTLSFYQYRIDYDIPGLPEEMPFFAAVSEQSLEVGSSLSFSILPIGNQQRELLMRYIPADEVYTGTATVTFAGWDMNNAVITLPTEGAHFSLGAGNFSALSDIASTTTGN